MHSTTRLAATQYSRLFLMIIDNLPGIHIDCRINGQVNISLIVIDCSRCRWTNYVRVCVCVCVVSVTMTLLVT